jgi:hypothetical protein
MIGVKTSPLCCGACGKQPHAGCGQDAVPEKKATNQ